MFGPHYQPEDSRDATTPGLQYKQVADLQFHGHYSRDVSFTLHEPQSTPNYKLRQLIHHL